MLALATKKIINRTYQTWKELLPKYPADKYTLRIAFFKNINQKFVLTAAADGVYHTLTLDPASDDYNHISHGTFNYQAIAKEILTGNESPVETGSVVFYPNLAIDKDPRGMWQIIYENLLEVYEGLSEGKISTALVMVERGKQVNFTDPDKMLGHIAHAKTMMEIETGKKKGNTIFKSRFR